MFLPAVYYLLANDGGLREGCDDDSYRSKLIKNVTSWTFLVWTGYPVVWAFCSGLEYWSVDRECMAYAILDILAKICWGFMIVNSPAAIAEVYASAGSERLNIAQDSTGPGLGEHRISFQGMSEHNHLHWQPGLLTLTNDQLPPRLLSLCSCRPHVGRWFHALGHLGSASR
jgi:hypothetical protein